MHTKQHAPEHSGRFAVVAWIICGVFIVWASDQLRFFTMEFLVYLTVGSIIAGMVLGGVYHLVRGLIAAVIGAALGDNVLRSVWPFAVIALMLGFVFATYQVSDLTIRNLHAWLGPDQAEAYMADGVIYCSVPLPPFTLDGETTLDRGEAGELCACIWRGMDDRERSFFTDLDQGGGAADDYAESEVQAIARRFGSVARQCL